MNMRIGTTNALVALTTILVSTQAVAAQSWTQLAPSGTPHPAGYLPSAVYDAVTNQMIVFGGTDRNTGNFNNVTALSLAASPQWTPLSPAGNAPGPRAGQTEVYDSINSRMIVFGGGLGNSSPCANDVWALSNANSLTGTPTWNQLSPLGSPPAPRRSHSAIYDSNSNRMIIFGGNDCFSGFYNDVWVLSGANGLGGTPEWTQVIPAGTPPSPSLGHSAVYDSNSNRMIVFGTLNAGMHSNQTWVLTNANGIGATPTWIQLAPTGTLIPPTIGHAAVYDPSSNRMTILGGGDVTDSNATWVLSNANGIGGTPAWIQINPSGALPPPREGFPAIYNAVKNEVTIFGGYSNGPVLNDVWVLKGANGISPCTPIMITNANASPDTLWPPNHKMVPVVVTLSTSGECGSASCQITSVSSNEPVDTDGDWVITGKLTLDLRAERLGNRTGRIYTITIECTDGSGNTSERKVNVSVTHDRAAV